MSDLSANQILKLLDANPDWPADLIDKAERAFYVVQQGERGTFKKSGKIMREENNKDLSAFADALEAHMKGEPR